MSMHFLDWLSRLVSFDTTSSNSNLELIEDVKAWLTKQGVETRLTHSFREPKANLFATLPAQDGTMEGGLILSGHTDVVPIDGQKWDTPPFQATKIEDKIFGRGCCDMKGFLAVALSLVPEFLQMKRSKPLHLALSYDEEIGCLGAPLMIQDLAKHQIKPGACLVGEPTGMRPIIAHKGRHTYRCTLHGFAAHSSLVTSGCNSIEYAAQLICFLRSLSDQHKQNGPFDSLFDVAFTTFSTNLIQGGNAENTIPAFCELLFEFRNLPEDDPSSLNKEIVAYIFSELLPQIRRENSKAEIILKTLTAVPAFEAYEDAKITQMARLISGEKEKLKVSYGTEAGQFQAAKIPSLLCGPGFIKHAHHPNEYVSLDQLEKCQGFLRQLVGLWNQRE